MSEIKHGKHTTYNARGCRCGRCREAHRLYQRAWMERRKGQCPSSLHGTWTGYCQYACRCKDCLSAGSRRNRENYLARRARRVA